MKLTDKKKTLIAELALLTCGLIWGSSFSVLKNTLDYLPVNWLLAMRFFIAGLILLLMGAKNAPKPLKPTLLGGLAAGVFIYLGFLFQTNGLATTTAGSNAFLTSVYVVVVPFMQWAVHKKYPGIKAIIAAVLCLTGVGVIALNAGFSIGAGDAWTLGGGVFFSVHIIFVAHFSSKNIGALTFTGVQMLTCATLSTINAAFTEPLPTAQMLLHPTVVWSLLYLIVLGTVFTMGAQNIALRYAPASHASLLMSTEAPFGFLFGILLLGEPLTLRFVLGAALIVSSIVYSELGKGARKHTPKTDSAPA